MVRHEYGTGKTPDHPAEDVDESRPEPTHHLLDIPHDHELEQDGQYQLKEPGTDN